jgi:phospholipid transport system substrate-binding protein
MIEPHDPPALAHGNHRTSARLRPARRSIFTAIASLSLVVALIAPGGRALAMASSGDPTNEVKSTISDAVAIFKDNKSPLVQRREELHAIAARHFDFQDMARSALGYHWRALTPAQRNEFVPLFANFIQDAFLSKLQEYTVKKIQEQVQSVNVQYLKETFDDPDYAQVFTSVAMRDQKDPLQANYLMHRSGGRWRIYDVNVDAISVIANYRNQFNRVLNNDGYDKLAADLRAKQKQLQQYLDHQGAQASTR